jgi:hypothetical protein
MYPLAVRDRFIINDPTLQGVERLGDISTTIDTLAQDATTVIQASTSPNQPATYGGIPIGGAMPSAGTIAGVSIGTILVVGVGVFLLARMAAKR